MLKSLKDMKRRTVETVLEVAGASEKTVDPEYDSDVAKFQEMVQDLNETGASVTSVLTLQKSYFADTEILAKCLHRIYSKNSNPEYWSKARNELHSLNAVSNYAEAIAAVHNVYRSSSAMVCNELSIEPLRSAVLALCPDIDAACKIRNDTVIDYDSYKRRQHALKQKHEKASTEQPLKTQKLEEIAAELAKFDAKVESTSKLYEQLNENAKKDIIASRLAHDHLIEMIVITFITCQAELFSRAAKHLQDIVNTLPQDKVAQVRSRVDQYIRQGGPNLKTAEKTTLQKGLDVAVGKALVSELKKPSEEEQAQEKLQQELEVDRMAALVHQEEVARSNTMLSKSSSFPIPPKPPGPPIASKEKFVIALFDHEAEDADELPFKTGERIQVLEVIDASWWTGRVNGKEGMFPVNYVKVEEN